MLLILNCFVKDEYAVHFNRSIAKYLNDVSSETFRLTGTEEITDLSRYTRLIVSGSEASALDDNSWDRLLMKIIQHFIVNKKPVLGICYGHQFLARALVGKECLRKRPEPEAGWIKITTTGNGLFNSIKELVSFVLHYDEVVFLTEDFRVIASTECCPIHAFQYKDLPVWGIQFHPEYNTKEAGEILDSFSALDPKLGDIFTGESKPSDVDLVVSNFLDVQPR